LTHIEERLKQIIKKTKTPYILLYTLYNEFESECKAEGIPSAYALHACLKARSIPGIVFMRSPYVSTTSQKHKRMTLTLFADWIAKQKSTVPYLSLNRHANKIGLDTYQLVGNVTAHKSIIRYGSRQLVHLDSLAWNQQKQETLLNVARVYWKYCVANHSLFARTDELLSRHKNELPVLVNNITWTSELIFSLLSRSNDIVTFGNSRMAYGVKTDDSLKSLGDIVARILRDNFGGQASLSDLSAYLREELKILRTKLSPNMLGDHPEIVITDDEIYLADRKIIR